MKVFDVLPLGSGIRALRMNPQDALSTDKLTAAFVERGHSPTAADTMTQLVFDVIEELIQAQRHTA